MNAEAIFIRAIEASSETECRAYLDQACAGNTELRARVERLLVAHHRPDSFLEVSPQRLVVAGRAERADGVLGQTIGPYKLLELIGEGGMGLVFMAEQRSPVKRAVALKIIKPGLDTRQLIGRFEGERQALAMMEHPSIAKIFDMGTTNLGHPYFVMELVRGIPITAYCDQARLKPRERLELFVTVCQAVQHAHQKGIVHRDLKPANILVTMHDDKAVPKIIDFGVAKALGEPLVDRTMFTNFLQMIGTPAYMSPEQAQLSSLDVDTRSDVYSLGVLLYELLTGRMPFDRERLRRAGFDELRRIIGEEEPPRPSARVATLDAASLSTVAENRAVDRRSYVSTLRGDLDWIAMKSLEKDRTRRYESAGALAADVRRYLVDEPVEACPPSAAYRTRKFAQKHRVALAMGAIVAMAMLIGIVVSTWQALRATRAQAQANTKEKEALSSAMAERAAVSAHFRQRERAEASEKLAKERLAETVRQGEAVSQSLYFSDLRLGLVDWNAGNILRLSRKLLSHVPINGEKELRGWEWFYLMSLCHEDERTLFDHRRRITSVAWSPNGRYLATTSYGGYLVVYDAINWKVLESRRGYSPQALSWSGDSRRLAWGETHHSIAAFNGPHVMEIETGEVTTFLGNSKSLWATAWSADGKHLAAGGSGQEIRIWDSQTGECRRVVEKDSAIRFLAWRPSEHLMAITDKAPELTIWDPTSGELLQAIRPNHSEFADIVSAVWSPDAQSVAVATKSGSCLIYRTNDWSLASQWNAHKGKIYSIAWQSDGSRLASAGEDNLIRLWDPHSGECTSTLRGHSSQVQSISYEPNGRRIASGDGNARVKIWNVPSTPQPRRLNAGQPQTFAWCEHGDRLWSVAISDSRATLWNVIDERRLAESTVARGRAACFSAGAKTAAVVADQPPKIFIHDTESGANTMLSTMVTVPGRLCALAPDASQLAVSDGAALETVDLRQDSVPVRRESIRVCRALSWSPDGRFLAVAGSGKSDSMSSFFMSWVHLFDKDLREPILSLRHGESNVQATAVTWSPDGRQLASGDENGLVEVWDVRTTKKMTSSQLHTAGISTLAWSPDGRRVASGGGDATVRIWEPINGEELLKLEVEGKVTQLEWSPEGRRLAAATADGAVNVWDANSAYAYVRGDAFNLERVHVDLARAIQHQLAGRNEQARAILERILEGFKDRIDTFPRGTWNHVVDQAGNAMIRGDYPNAIEFSRWLLRLKTADAQILSDIALRLATCPNSEFRSIPEAVDLARQAVALGPMVGDFHRNLGVCLARADDWSGALAALEEAARLRFGGDGSDWFLLAIAHWKHGNKADAVRYYDRAVNWMNDQLRVENEVRLLHAEAIDVLGLAANSDNAAIERPDLVPPPDRD